MAGNLKAKEIMLRRLPQILEFMEYEDRGQFALVNELFKENYCQILQVDKRTINRYFKSSFLRDKHKPFMSLLIKYDEDTIEQNYIKIKEVLISDSFWQNDSVNDS